MNTNMNMNMHACALRAVCTNCTQIAHAFLEAMPFVPSPLNNYGHHVSATSQIDCGLPYILICSASIVEHGRDDGDSTEQVSLLVVFFGVVAILEEQHVFAPIIDLVLGLSTEAQVRSTIQPSYGCAYN